MRERVEGRLLNRGAPARPKLRIAARLVLGLAVLVSLGTAMFLLPWATTRPFTVSEAAFTATSALAVTGLSVITPARDLTLLGQTILMIQIQIGGVGFMALAVIVLRLLGRKVTFADRLALRDSLGLLEPRAILRMLAGILVTAGAIQLAGAIVLWLHWVPLLGPERAAFYAIFHAASTFCNAGFDLFSGTAIAGGGIPRDGLTLAVVGAMIVLGGLGIPVLGDLFWRRGRLSLHSRITLVVYVVLIVVGAMGFLVAETRPGGALVGVPLSSSARFSVFQSISTRTAGITGLPNFELLTPASQWMTMLLMLIGSAPASMGGGITTGTFAVLVVSLWAQARGQRSTRIGGRSIAAETIRKAAAVLTVALLLISVATWLILVTHPVTLQTALFEVISAFATVGLTLAFTDRLNFFGQLIIMFVMFWGRLGALTVVAALARTGPPDPLSYPEEHLLLG